MKALRHLTGPIAIVATMGACESLDNPKLPPEGQIVLFVDTDAIVPLAPTEPQEETLPAPIFDRLRIEMMEPGVDGPCKDCTREFAVDRRMFKGKTVSVGLVPRVGVSGYRARATLYRTFRSEIAGPRPASSLVSIIALPAIAAEGIVQVHVVLKTENLGAPQGTLEAPLPAGSGAPPASLVDTWAREQRVTCTEPPREGEVCIPGGAYWYGDLTATQPTEQLVALSPFYLDSTEVTVRRMRASPLASSISTAASQSGRSTTTWTPTTRVAPRCFPSIRCAPRRRSSPPSAAVRGTPAAATSARSIAASWMRSARIWASAARGR